MVSFRSLMRSYRKVRKLIRLGKANKDVLLATAAGVAPVAIYSISGILASLAEQKSVLGAYASRLSGEWVDVLGISSTTISSLFLALMLIKTKSIRKYLKGFWGRAAIVLGLPALGLYLINRFWIDLSGYLPEALQGLSLDDVRERYLSGGVVDALSALMFPLGLVIVVILLAKLISRRGFARKAMLIAASISLINITHSAQAPKHGKSKSLANRYEAVMLGSDADKCSSEGMAMYVKIPTGALVVKEKGAGCPQI